MEEHFSGINPAETGSYIIKNTRQDFRRPTTDSYSYGKEIYHSIGLDDGPVYFTGSPFPAGAPGRAERIWIRSALWRPASSFIGLTPPEPYVEGSDTTPSGEIQLLANTWGPFAASLLLLMARPVIAVCLATAVLVTSGFVFNEVFFTGSLISVLRLWCWRCS